MSPSLKNTLIGLILLSVLFWAIERLIGKVRGPLIRRGWWTDVAYFFFTPFVTRVFTKSVLILPVVLLVWCGVASAADFQSRAYVGYGPVSRQPLWLQGLEVYLLADFLGYWSHRLFHRGKWWPFHAVHHSSEELDWLSSVRVHPVNDMVNKFIQVTPLLLLGFNPWVTLSTAPFFTLYAIFIHSRLNWDFGPLRAVIATPVFHRWHHSRQADAMDKNFAGLLPVWDIMFGTYYMPRDKMPEDFGVAGGFPQDMPNQIWVPVRNLWR